MRYAHFCLFSAISITTPTTALAQAPAQTLDGAMRFLSTIAQAGTLRMEVATTSLSGRRYNQIEVRQADWYYKNTQRSPAVKFTTNWDLIPPYKIEKVDRLAQCVLAFSFTPHPRPEEAEFGPRHEAGSTLKEYGSYTPPASPISVDFTKIASSSTTGYDNTIIEMGGHPVRFIADSKDLAVRVAYAVEFIRQNCDPAASTGF